ncbi:MAG TPA: restriction endonuclease subunit S [Saprospiraceae bacterium]|nr:restriction endonuclease subunit S [Saprospiraceae bacterium]
MRKGWEVKRLGEICSLDTGGTPSRSKPQYFNKGNIKWLVSGDIHKKEIFDCEGRITEEGMQNSNAKYLPLNSVLIALNGQGITRGSVALLRTKATCNQSLVSIIPKNINYLIPEYLYCNLHGRYDEIRRMTGDAGNERRGLNMPLIRGIEISIPSLHEQKRIVSFLGETFAAIDKAKSNVQRNLQNARELFESYLENIFENMNEDWQMKRLADITEVKDGTHDSPKYIKDGIPFVTQKNIKETGLTLVDTQFITNEDHEKFYKRSNVTYGDIIISMIGANRGMTCIVDDRKIFSIKNVGLIKQSENINQNYLLYYLKTPKAKEYVKESSNGGAQEFVGLTALRNFPIIVAPKKRQNTIVSNLNALSTETNKLKSIYQQKLKDLEELKKSILQKAFAGELTK